MAAANSTHGLHIKPNFLRATHYIFNAFKARTDQDRAHFLIQGDIIGMNSIPGHGLIESKWQSMKVIEHRLETLDVSEM
jgi:hypothetical protein